MQSPICAMLGIEFPLLAFSHCRDVVVAVSKAGGMGVFGAAALPPERLEEELQWIDAHIGGLPYGVDLIVPNSFVGKGEAPSSGAGKVPENAGLFRQVAEKTETAKFPVAAEHILGYTTYICS